MEEKVTPTLPPPEPALGKTAEAQAPSEKPVAEGEKGGQRPTEKFEE